MRPSFVRAVAATGALAWAVAAVGGPPAGEDAARLDRLTRERFAANAAGDRGFYERLLAPHFQLLEPFRPPVTRREYLDAEFGRRPPGVRLPPREVSDLRALVDGGTATVTYRVAEPTQVGPLLVRLQTLRLDTYVRRDGRWQLTSMSVSEIASWPDVAAVDPATLSEYAGTYRLAPGVEVEVTTDGQHLYAALAGQERVELFPESAASFFDRTDSPLARTVFLRDPDGRVVAQAYRFQGQTVRYDRVR
jgi:hypothetical protein